MYTIPTYDKNGNVTQTQVRQNNWQTGTLIAQTKTEYDAMNRAVKAHSFNGGNWTTPYATIETTYDIFGDVSETKDPRGLKTAYTRDYLGRVTKQTLPDGDWVETRYNSLNQVTKAWTSQSGTETSPAVSNTHDKFNRLSQVSYKNRRIGQLHLRPRQQRPDADYQRRLEYVYLHLHARPTQPREDPKRFAVGLQDILRIRRRLDAETHVHSAVRRRYEPIRCELRLRRGEPAAFRD